MLLVLLVVHVHLTHYVLWFESVQRLGESEVTQGVFMLEEGVASEGGGLASVLLYISWIYALRYPAIVVIIAIILLYVLIKLGP